jgi:hypothetical protein
MNDAMEGARYMVRLRGKLVPQPFVPVTFRMAEVDVKPGGKLTSTLFPLPDRLLTE